MERTRARLGARRLEEPRRQPHSVAADLAAEIQARIEGEVRFDAGSRALYATDLSMYRQVPIGVVIPRSIHDVIQTVAVCRDYQAPILGRGCGTSLAGQTCNVAVVIDFSKYLNRILEIDQRAGTAWVEPGVIYDQLKDATERYHLLFAPDPATHEYCTLGGMVGNNSCGSHSLMGGKTDDNIEELDILTYDGLRLQVGRTEDAELQDIIREGGRRGEIYSQLKGLRDRYTAEIRGGFPHIPRRVSGYNLEDLLPENGFHLARALVGSESTCALTLRAKVRLIPSPPHRALLVIGYPDPAAAGYQVPALRAQGPIALEAFHVHVIDNMLRKGKSLSGAPLLPEGRTWMLVEFGGETRAEARDRARQVMDQIQSTDIAGRGIKLYDDPADQKALWEIRELGVGSSRIPHVEDAWPGWEDSAVSPDRLGDYLRDFTGLLGRYAYPYTLFGHFGQGCVHTRIAFDPKTAAGVAAFRSFMNDAADLVVSYGGSLSGEHGDGQARGELLPKMFGPALMQAFREFKSIWDPGWRMNPGKLIDANPLDQNLRTGPDYHPRPVATRFQFPDDLGSLATASERCFGVGKCRGLEGGTMCPSFRATREEMHSTRGRAHMLFELLRGDSLEDGWRNEHVKEALDLCLACKGCKGECPVSVDMATYKAEFLSHYYESNARPRSAYAFGLIFRWARLASRAPGLANLVTQTPGLRGVARAVAGMAPERQIPAFAGESFTDWFARRQPRPATQSRVLLWPDTFNNYFFPQTARAAVRVLEAAGFEVEVPRAGLCCGRPLYDYGMLDQAKRQLRQILETLRPEIEAGVPLVGLEPSCLAVFRDELHSLFPRDEDARRLGQQSYLFSEFLQQRAPDFQLPTLSRLAIVHGHCHHKAIMQMDDEEAVLTRAGLDYQVLDSGCCGMAGSFGFEKGEHYDVSMKVGELVLLPAVRRAAKDTLIVADGFSCREQIAQSTDRQALHLAEVLDLALRQGDGGAPARYPERAFAEPAPVGPSPRGMVAAGAGLLAAGGLAWLARRRSRARGDR